MLNGIDGGNLSLLTLLDLSAAFDTIDHSILIQRLSASFGIKGTSLLWFTCYLTNRVNQVRVKDSISMPLSIKYGVPQGSVLGPILFSLYIQPLSRLIRDQDFSCHFYAEDSQIYTSIPPSLFDKAATETVACITLVNNWMQANKLKMNRDKTEIIVSGSRRSTTSLSTNSITIDDEEIHFSPSQRFVISASFSMILSQWTRLSPKSNNLAMSNCEKFPVFDPSFLRMLPNS